MGRKIKVEYACGESRKQPGMAVDYMLSTIEEVGELYAEEIAVDDETANYERLKKEILTQAKEANISEESLEFL